MLLLLQSTDSGTDIADTVIKAAIGVGVAQLIAGGFLLIGWYYVQKRFVDHEFPGIIERMTKQMASLETSLRNDIAGIRLDISGVRQDIGAQGRQLERHDERLGHQGRRIDRLETRLDNDSDRRRDRDALDDTRAGR